jgi:DnaJ domain
MPRESNQTLLKWQDNILSLNYDQCYKLLGLKESASIHEIRDAYRRLVLEYHPDKNSSAKDGAKFKLITEAYRTLRIKNGSADRNSRSKYDDVKNKNHLYKRLCSWIFYLNLLYSAIDYTTHTRYVGYTYRYFLKYEPVVLEYYGRMERHVIIIIHNLVALFSYRRITSFISHMSYRHLTRDLLKYLGLHQDS